MKRISGKWPVLLALAGVLVPAGVAWAAAGTLGLAPPWGTENLVTRDGVRGIALTYSIKTSGSIPQEAVDAVESAIMAWNDAIATRSLGQDWFFVLEPMDGGSASGGGAPSFSHKPQHDPGSKGKGGGSGGDPDITIQIKKGGGVIAGSAQRSFNADGFVVGVKIQISGSAFGLANDPATIEQVTMHEVGHALSLGHHSSEDDLMGETVGYEGGGPSDCDLDGFVLAHDWVVTGADTPYVAATSIICD